MPFLKGRNHDAYAGSEIFSRTEENHGRAFTVQGGSNR